MRLQRRDFFEQAGHILRFGIEIVAACGDRLFPIAGHGIPKSRSDFSATFTTIAFDNSSLRWLEINT